MSKVQYGKNYRGLSLSVSTKNSKYIDFFRTGPSLIRKTYLKTLSETQGLLARADPRDQSTGYVKYRISNPNPILLSI